LLDKLVKKTAKLILAASTLFAASGLALAGVADTLAVGEDAWTRRAERHHGPRAAPEPIQKAVDAYRISLDAEPENLEARWKLLRALYFQGEFVLDNPDSRLELFEHSRDVADAGVRQIERQHGLRKNSLKMKPQEVAEAVGKDAMAAEIYFWCAAHWGMWGRYSSKVAAARQGVAGRVRQFAEIVILLDEYVESAGGHRLLGRLHTKAPKIPFVTGWVSKDQAISELRHAWEIAPHDLLNNFFLAEALLKSRREQKEEAMNILRIIVQSHPDPNSLVEDIKTIEDAEALLTILNN